MVGTVDITHHKKYLESECWKCGESPTGAHHWLEHDNVWICKYCCDVRKWPMSFGAAIREQGATEFILLISNKEGGVYG